MLRDVTSIPPTPPVRPEPATAAAPAGRSAAEQPTGGVAVSIHNPHLRIEAALNLVVLEFRDSAGEVRTTIPSPREIAAYRTTPDEAAAARPGELDVEG